MGLANRREQEAQIVVNLGNGAHRRTWAAAGGFLFDRNRRAQAINGVHIRPFHLIQELAGVGGERLYIAPLTLSINRIERQRRLPRPAQSGDYRERVTRDLDIDVLKIVLAGAPNRNFPDGHCSTAVCTLVMWTSLRKCWKVGLRGSTHVS